MTNSTSIFLNKKNHGWIVFFIFAIYENKNATKYVLRYYEFSVMFVWFFST